jgi:hypothetical protein
VEEEKKEGDKLKMRQNKRESGDGVTRGRKCEITLRDFDDICLVKGIIKILSHANLIWFFLNFFPSSRHFPVQQTLTSTNTLAHDIIALTRW